MELKDPTRRRHLRAEVWYPTDEADGPVTYSAVVGQTPVELPGTAKRDALETDQTYPLIIISHGQPGTRYQFAYLGENLASQGFVVASLDHTGSTYQDMTAEAYLSSLVYRPEDILFALAEVPKRMKSADGDTIGLIGYSYGGYSVINAAGAPLDGQAFDAFCDYVGGGGPCFARPAFSGLEAARGDAIEVDPRIKAVFVMAPYGQPWFGKASLARLKVPFFVASGDADDVASYLLNAAMFFSSAGSRDKYLLTLRGGQHNPFAECPEEIEVAERCGDPVWEQEEAHTLIESVATAFFATFLQGQRESRRYLSPALPGLNPGERPAVTLETSQSMMQ